MNTTVQNHATFHPITKVIRDWRPEKTEAQQAKRRICDVGFFYVHVLRMAHGFRFWRAVWGTRKGAPVLCPVRQPARSATLDWRRGWQVLKLVTEEPVMADVITMARKHAPIKSTTDISTTNPEAIRLHGLACNALTTALHLFNRIDATPAQVQQATARAVRAATCLKRLSAMNSGVAV